MLDFRDLGAHYRKVRESRGYTMGDVTSDNLNKSQVSRFENGTQMLLLDGFMHAISGLNMTMSEFFLTIGNFEAGSLQTFGKKLQDLINAQDIDGLKALITRKPRTNEKKIFNVKVKCAIRELSGQNLLTDEECQFVDKYLTDREEWTAFDISVFGMCLESLDTDIVYQLGLQLLKKDKFRILPYNARIAKRTLVNVYVYMVLHGRFIYADEFEKKLATLLKVADTEEKITVQIFRKISKYRQEKEPELLMEIDRDIQNLKDLGATGLARMVESFLVSFK
ncbi:Rgg/GadR/MutR family transcriptional regulator [Pseudolactococcus yaeyamensis]